MPLPVLRRFRVRENRRDSSEVFTLFLEPADGELVFPFLAGQWVMLHLLNPDGSTWAKTAFSMANAPCEKMETLELAIKVYGDFTKRAQELKPGDEVNVQGPYGVFTLRPDAKQLVFLAGGIGITPLRSMVREALLTKKPVDITLLYSEKRADFLLYADEFAELAKSHPNFHPVFVLTREAPPGWKGETSRITAEMVKKYVPDFASARYVVCGPDGFMKAIRDMLVAEGVDPKASLQKESFG